LVILPAYQFLGAPLALGNSNMIDGDNSLGALIKTLRSLQKSICAKVADRLKKQLNTFNSYDLHLRSCMLNPSDAKKIGEALRSVHQNHDILLKSFSVSYNPTIGSSGAMAILSSLKKNIEELEMVGCNLGDETGKHLVEYILQSENLATVCVEENNFSQKLKDEILDLKQQTPDCKIIV